MGRSSYVASGLSGKVRKHGALLLEYTSLQGFHPASLRGPEAEQSLLPLPHQRVQWSGAQDVWEIWYDVSLIRLAMLADVPSYMQFLLLSWQLEVGVVVNGVSLQAEEGLTVVSRVQICIYLALGVSSSICITL